MESSRQCIFCVRNNSREKQVRLLWTYQEAQEPLWLVLSWVIQGWQLHPSTSNHPIKCRKPFLYLKEIHFQSVSSGRRELPGVQSKASEESLRHFWQMGTDPPSVLNYHHDSRRSTQGPAESTQGHILNVYQCFYKTVTELLPGCSYFPPERPTHIQGFPNTLVNNPGNFCDSYHYIHLFYISFSTPVKLSHFTYIYANKIMQCTYRSLVLKVEVSGLKFVCLIKKTNRRKNSP